ncbi:MAG TPA: GNAT family N-acetyltransferase [Dehalococcoidia bacterium]|nr:GNAT family N-acetyltransferase [Dehalococcoidia bacterium]
MATKSEEGANAVLIQRPVNLKEDEEFVLNLACMASYESVPAWYRNTSYRAYRESWFESGFPAQVIAELKRSLGEPRTVIEVWLEDSQRAGLLWFDFAESPQGRKVATLRDLVVEPGHQRRGIGRLMLRAVEAAAREKGAGVLRVETSLENEATQKMYQHAGFTVARLIYEKVLDG